MIVLLSLVCIVCVEQRVRAATSESHVQATVSCTFESGAHVSVHAQMIVNRIDNIYDTSYDRQMIESIATSDPEVIGIIKQRLRDSLRHQLELAFPDAEIAAVDRPTYSIPYFRDTFSVNLTTAYFGYEGTLDLSEFISGVLDMGATVTYQGTLQATEGWNVTYVYTLPSTVMISYANTDQINAAANTVTWEVLNWHGDDDGKEATLKTRYKNPTSPSDSNEEIALEFILDTRLVSSVSLTESIVAKKVSISTYNVLPKFISEVDVLPADGVRLFIDNGLLSWDALRETTMQPIEQSITPLIENSSFNQPLNVVFSWDPDSTTNCSTPFNISHMDDAPALRANYKDAAVQLRICDMPARAFFGLMHAGATASIAPEDVNFNVQSSELEWPYTGILQLPSNITINGSREVTWNDTRPLAGAVSSDLAPDEPYENDVIETRVDVEFSKMDLNIPSAFTGKTELTATVNLKEDAKLYVIRQPSELSFSPQVNLSFVNSDALRLCIEEHVFEDSQVTTYLARATELFQQQLSEILHGVQVKGSVDRKAFSNSLLWDGDISAMDAVTPVVIANTANEVYPVKFNISVWPAQLTIEPQQFMLYGRENQVVTYRLVFPRGVSVNASESAGKPVIAGQTNDGRQYVELVFDPQSSANASLLTCVLTVSPVYVLGMFLPCILVFILLIILIVILVLLRRKRGGFRREKQPRERRMEPEESEPVDDAEPEYYVPPPPPSTRKRKMR